MAVAKRKSKPSSSTHGKRKSWSPGHQSQKRVLQETNVYLMSNFPFFMLNKFGISDHTAARRKNVSETTPGVVGTIWSANLAFGYMTEQWVHGLYKFQNVYFWTGSGRTEWFVVFSPLVGCVTWYLDRRFGLDLSYKQMAFAFFTPFVWWDGLFWLLFFRAFKFVVGFAAMIFVMYLLAHTK